MGEHQLLDELETVRRLRPCGLVAWLAINARVDGDREEVVHFRVGHELETIETSW